MRTQHRNRGVLLSAIVVASSLLLLTGGASADTIECGFETAEGFTEGFLDAQSGWTVESGNTSQPTVSAVNPHSGLQHLRMDYDGSAPGNVVAYGPSLGLRDGTRPSTVEARVFVSTTGGPYFTLKADHLSAGLATWEITLTDFGRFLVVDDVGYGPQSILAPDTFTWAPDEYASIRVECIPATGTIEYYYNDTLIYTGQIYAGTAVEQVLVISDNYNATSHMDVDELIIDSASPSEIFSNGFEQGNTLEWDVTSQ